VRYIEPLLVSVRDVFCAKFAAAVAAGDLPAERSDLFSFRPLFDACLAAAESQSSHGGLRAVGGSGGGGGGGGAARAKPAAAAAEVGAPASAAPSSPAAPSSAMDRDDDDDDGDAAMLAARSALSLRSLKSAGGGGSGGKRGGKAASAGKAPVPAKGGGALAPLPGLGEFKYSKEAERGLDRSSSGGGGGDAPAAAAAARVEFRYDGSSGRDLDESDAELVAAAAAVAGAGGKAAAAAAAADAAGPKGAVSSVASWFARSSVGTFLQSLTGNKVLDREDLAPAMEQLQSLLVSKNVAREPAEQLCESVVASLAGRKLEVAGSVAAVVAGALRDAIERILTPRRAVDLLAEVRAKKAAGGGPYVIAVVGVNGVGKSTSLSKVAYHLKDNRHSVLIAACDSFRAGAVEQLRRHCDALDIPLFSQGYAKDPVAIAAAAIRAAAEAAADVVLIDTAGRMQNNEGLMKQLAKLVSVNDPDLVLFVGEALVGNDGVDQLTEFNSRLTEYAANRDNPRRIDGIIMTKFDCVDDKVGAALSMVYKTGIPVLFLGTGQRYGDLRKLNVGAVVKALLA
jgi:signal recognition particle receptor subunit alpha